METSCNIKSTITHGIDPDSSVQDSRPLRAGNCKMAILPLVCTFSFEVAKNIQLCLSYFKVTVYFRGCPSRKKIFARCLKRINHKLYISTKLMKCTIR